MADRLALFADRMDAGRKLGEALERFRADDPVVLALPRGGVPVGYEVAAALDAPLDILLVRKLGAPFQPEYGIGAISENGVGVIRHEDVELIGMSNEELRRSSPARPRSSSDGPASTAASARPCPWRGEP